MLNQSYTSSQMLNQPSPILNQSYTAAPVLNQSFTPSFNQPNTFDQPTFLAKFIEGNRIRTCYGCGSPIRKDTSSVPPPSHDLIINFRERRLFRDPNTHQMRLSANVENTYYHAMLSCILQKHPAFKVYMLTVDDSAKPNLTEVHCLLLKEQFNYSEY